MQCYQVTLSHTPISYSKQLFLSSISISYSYLVFSHTPTRNLFVTNHYQLLISEVTRLVKYSCVTSEQGNNAIQIQIKFTAFTSLKILTGKKAPLNKTPTLSKSKNMDIWMVSTSNRLFIQDS